MIPTTDNSKRIYFLSFSELFDILALDRNPADDTMKLRRLLFELEHDPDPALTAQLDRVDAHTAEAVAGLERLVYGEAVDGTELAPQEEISAHWGVSDKYKKSQPYHNDLYPF